MKKGVVEKSKKRGMVEQIVVVHGGVEEGG